MASLSLSSCFLKLARNLPREFPEAAPTRIRRYSRRRRTHGRSTSVIRPIIDIPPIVDSDELARRAPKNGVVGRNVRILVIRIGRGSEPLSALFLLLVRGNDSPGRCEPNRRARSLRTAAVDRGGDEGGRGDFGLGLGVVQSRG
jgi:alkanesulfonate monooxygenase SsuD/methylene tetrahydromethanopterin reductase-like flavin-dependent oxidoreductase (luciferase family)